LVFFAVLYISSVLFAAFMTVREQRRSALSGAGLGAGYRMIGILACLIWPLVAVACVVLSGPSQVGQAQVGQAQVGLGA
jgi:hypothetical protein